ncbi:MAG TPA: hypothetical protein VNO30_17385 [Kofleriaceae bacterium]|nr:hypothetical protein [Kofleriaceae bacterium]
MPNVTPALASSITKLGMVRFAISQQSTVSGGKAGVWWNVELPAFMHDVRPSEVAAPLPPPGRRSTPAFAPMPAPVPSPRAFAPREKPAATPPRAYAPREKPAATPAPRIRPPSLLGMPWRWL